MADTIVTRPAMIRKLSQIETKSGPCRHLQCTDEHCVIALRRNVENFEGDMNFGDNGDFAW